MEFSGNQSWQRPPKGRPSVVRGTVTQVPIDLDAFPEWPGASPPTYLPVGLPRPTGQLAAVTERYAPGHAASTSPGTATIEEYGGYSATIDRVGHTAKFEGFQI